MKKILVYLLILASSTFSCLNAVELVKTDDKLNNLLSRYKYVVAYIYDLPRQKQKEERTTSASSQASSVASSSAAEELEERFTSGGSKRDKAFERYADMLAVSQKPRYERAKIHFLAVNMALDGLPALKNSLKFDGNDIVVLFKNGGLYGRRITADDITIIGITDLIEAEFGSEIDDYLEQKKQEAIEARKEAEAEAQRRKTAAPTAVTERVVYVQDDNRPRVYVGGGWGYPYWGYGPYWRRPYWGGGYWGGRPGFGIGIGFGGGRRWR